MRATNKNKILVSALSVLMAGCLIVYSGWAWFVSSKVVMVQGVTLNVQAPNNVQISLTGGVNDSVWSEEVTVDVGEVLKNQIEDFDDQLKHYLLPASTYSGFDDTVFATKRAMSDGSAYLDTIFDKGTAIAFSSQSEAYEGHYLDIPIYFRTMDVDGVSLYLDKSTGDGITPTSITAPDDSEIYKTARLAFLNSSKDANSLNETNPLIFADEGRQTSYVVVSSTQVDKVPDYILFDENSKMSTEKIISIAPALDNPYSYSSMVARVWVEGQDKNCTRSIGGKTFTIKLKFTAM